MKRHHKPTFRDDGYSLESLDLLKSAEGQLNAVFACFGSAAQHAQFFEEALENFIKFAEKLRGTYPVSAQNDT